MAWLAAAAGFTVGFVLTLVISIPATVTAECDGPCFEEWHLLLPLSIAVGLAVAALAGSIVHLLRSGRRR